MTGGREVVGVVGGGASSSSSCSGVFEAVTCKDIPLTGTQLQSLYEDTIPEVHDDVDTSTFLPDPDNTPMWLGDEGSDDDGSEDMTGWEPRPKLFIKLKEPRLVDVVGFM